MDVIVTFQADLQVVSPTAKSRPFVSRRAKFNGEKNKGDTFNNGDAECLVRIQISVAVVMFGDGLAGG